MESAGKETALFVLSDHGFCTFHRAVNINSWYATTATFI